MVPLGGTHLVELRGETRVVPGFFFQEGRDEWRRVEVEDEKGQT